MWLIVLYGAAGVGKLTAGVRMHFATLSIEPGAAEGRPSGTEGKKDDSNCARWSGCTLVVRRTRS